MVQNGPKWRKEVTKSPRFYKTVQNGKKKSKFSKSVKNVSKLFKMSKFVKTTMLQCCLKRFKMVNKSFKWSANFPKWPKKVKIHLKFVSKLAAVGVTAVVVTACKNYLKFLTIINIGSTIIL